MNLGRSIRLAPVFASLGVLLACGGVSDDGLYGPNGQGSTGTGGSVSGGSGSGGEGSCSDVIGTWATFVEVGVDWSSSSIKPGSGTVKQWIISERTQDGGQLLDRAYACGIGANGVPLGSPWFAIADIPDLNIFNEWTGVEFLANLFDLSTLDTVDIHTTLTLSQPGVIGIGDIFNTAANPFAFGYKNLPGDWPEDWEAMVPLAWDHDDDDHPGLTGRPFQGAVPEEGVDFRNPRLGISVNPEAPIPRASALYMTLRTQAGLRGEVVSCDPMRVEGEVAAGTLRIDTHIVDCVVEGTGEACTPEHIGFIDANLPTFEHNGTSVMISYKVPDGTTCAEVRNMEFEPSRP